jgi:hypothetical protein
LRFTLSTTTFERGEADGALYVDITGKRPMKLNRWTLKPS